MEKEEKNKQIEIDFSETFADDGAAIDKIQLDQIVRTIVSKTDEQDLKQTLRL